MATRATTDMPDGKANAPDDAVEVINPSGCLPFLFVCEHASNRIPADLGNLGVTPDILASHVAWDPGALAVSETMAAELDAPLVAHRISRLVYDCNRPPDAESAIPETSEICDIPGNRGLSPADRQGRVDRCYAPFHETVTRHLDEQIARAGDVMLITLHSFTPIYFGQRRDMEIGILHDDDARLADVMLSTGRALGCFDFRRNQPYGPADGVTHTLVKHAAPRGILNVMIEVRNDLIATADDQNAVAFHLCRVLRQAVTVLTGGIEDGVRSGRTVGAVEA